MLHELITTHRDAIVARAREKVSRRAWPLTSAAELDEALPLLLDQLTHILRSETASAPLTYEAIGGSEVRHANELRALGLSLPHIVQDYGDICDAITEVAVRQHISIAFAELQTLNRSLDTAVAEATAAGSRVAGAAPAGTRAVDVVS